MIDTLTLQTALMEAFGVAVETVLQPQNLFIIFLAVLFGMFLGLLPGLGGVVALALLIPLTFGMDPMVAFMLLTAALGGTNFAGSITAILINTPGSSPNAATLLDGYPMAQQGLAGRAIAASATASASGAVVGVILLTFSIPVLLLIVFLFTPIEVFWLGLWGMTLVSVVVGKTIVTGLISALLGCVFMIHGENMFTLTPRWTYGLFTLQDGFNLIPALIGLFAVAEMIDLLSKGETIAKNPNISVRKGRKKGIVDVYEHKWLFLRSAMVGSIIGVIPGAGGMTANYIAYFQAVKTSKNPDKFGTGDVRGVIASEASNDAKDGTGFIPTLGFGIPGSASMAVLLGAFTLHGMVPGPRFIDQNMNIVAVIILSLLISNILTSSIGLVLAEKLKVVTTIDPNYLAPPIIGVSLLGGFVINNAINDVLFVLLFGLLGFVMVRINMSRVPMILGMVLYPLVEESFHRSLAIGQGDFAVLVRSPLSLLLILLIVLSVISPFLKWSAIKGVVE